MKRSKLFSYIMMLVAASFTAPVFSQSSQHALYNYRNDGDFNAWLNDDIEKITYSSIDTQGVEHDDIVVQEVWTADTVYRIPLEAIDSIGFRAPKPEMREGLFYLRDYHAEHTSAVETLVLYFDTSIHKDSIPSVGQTIICATDATPYEEGFAGKVTEIRSEDNQIAIHCEEAAVGDIFKRLVLVGKASTEVEDEATKSRTRSWWNEPAVNLEDDGIIPIQLEEKSFEILDGMIKIKSPAPKLTCRYYVYVSEVYYEIFAQADIVHKDLTYTLDVSTNNLRSLKEYGEFFAALTSEERLAEWLEEKFKKPYKDFLKEELENDEIDAEKEIIKRIWEKKKVDIPIIGNGVINLSLMLAPLFKIKGNIEAISEFKTDAIQSLSMKIKGYTPLPRSGYISDFSASHKQDPIKNAKLDMKLTGGVTLGFVGLLNVNLLHRNVVYAGVGGELGMDLAGSLNVTLIDDQQPEMNMYDRLKDTKLKLCYYAKVYPEIGVTPLDILHLSGKNWDLTTWNVFCKEYTFYLMPHFTEPALPKFSNKTWSFDNPLGFYSTASKDIFFPCKVGMRITDTDGKVVKEYLDSQRYLEEYEWLNNPLNIDISDLSKGVSYKCYPTISFFGLNAFNAGPVHNFSVPLPLVASPKELILAVGSTNTVTFLGGWDTFAVVVSGEEGVASIKDDESAGVRQITVVGNKKGTAVLQIEDRRTGEVLNIPITVTDEPVAQSTISIDTEEINFGNVFVGNSKTKQFKVSNTGEHNLIFSVSETHGEFKIAESGKEFTLGPKEEKTFDVIYTPAKEETSSNGTITITSDAENNSSWTITLTGTGRSKGSVNLSVGLVAYYPFIGNADDVTGNGNNGTPKTNVTLTTGVEGDENGAYQFGGYSSPGHIYIPNSESLKFSEGVSFSAYIKPLSWVSMDGWGSRTSSGGLQCIMAKDHDRYGISLAFSGNDNGCRFWTHNMCNQKWSEISSGDQLKGNYLNKWTHVAYVYGDGYARLYVDGQLMDEREATPDFSTINSRDLYIGKFSDSWYPFNGVIDEVRIYNRTLTPAEVEKLAVFHEDL